MTKNNNPTPRSMIVLTEREKAEFFPARLERQLNALLLGIEWMQVPLANPSEWQALLESRRPEILIGAWETPSLPPTAARHLRYLCYLCGSVRSLVPRTLIEQGLLVSNWGSTISGTIAECALLLILSCLRRSTQWALAMHLDRGWQHNRHPEIQSLFRRRVGLHGLGAIGQELVRLLKPFQVELAAYSPSVPDEIFRRLRVTRVSSLADLFKRSDILVELAAGIPANRKLVTEELLRLLPPDAAFVNVGRGMVVDEQALIRVAREGRLQIGLDVYETEPLPADSPLRSLRNVTLLPHVAGPTPDRRSDCAKTALANLKRYLNGAPVENVVTLQAYDRAT